VTEDAAEFGEAAPEEFPAGPGDAPVPGGDETLESGGRPVERVEDDPNEGIPIVHARVEGDEGGEDGADG